MQITSHPLFPIKDAQSISFTWEAGGDTRVLRLRTGDDGLFATTRGLIDGMDWEFERPLSTPELQKAGTAFADAVAAVSELDLKKSLPSQMYATTQLEIVNVDGTKRWYGWPLGTGTPDSIRNRVVDAAKLLSAETYAAALRTPRPWSDEPQPGGYNRH